MGPSYEATTTMNKIILAALAVATIALTTAAEARPRQANQPPGWVDIAAQPAYPLAGAASRRGTYRRSAPRLDANGNQAKRTHHRAANRAMLIDKPQLYVKPDSPTDKLVTIQEYKRSVCTSNRGSTSLARVVEPLKSKAEEIVRECGAIIVSTDCRGGKTPNHREGRAVDIAMRGNASPACIYAHLKGWPGGVSTDYWTAPGTKHVHFSYSKRHEWGLRFAHSGGRRYAKRHVRHRVAAIERPYQTSADDRHGAPQYAIFDDDSRRGKYRSMKERRKALALQRHAAYSR